MYDVSDTGVDIFTDKVHYEIGDTVKIGIQVDPNRFQGETSVGFSFHGLSYSESFTIIPGEVFYTEYTFDDSFRGEVQVDARVSGIVDKCFCKDQYFFFVGVPNPTPEDFLHQRIWGHGGHWSNQKTNPEGYYSYGALSDPNAKSDVEIQAKEEIPYPCNVPEPQVPTEWQGDIGMNNPEIMRALRDATYQWNQDMQQCQREYELLVDERAAELQCGDFEFGEYTSPEEYDLLYNLMLNGLHEVNLDTSQVLVDNYRGTVQYENECNGYFKEYRQLVAENEKWEESCPDSGFNPNAKKHRYMLDIFNACRFATMGESSVQESTQGSDIVCGKGTVDVNGQCVPDKSSSKGGGCLIATATFGSELAPQVQLLREIRDNSLLNTESGTQFMKHFNGFYYSFSPTIADYERENPVFREMVKVAITPMVTSLSLMEYADSESSILGIGISLIMLNLGMYVGIPVIAIIRIRK